MYGLREHGLGHVGEVSSGSLVSIHPSQLGAPTCQRLLLLPTISDAGSIHRDVCSLGILFSKTSQELRMLSSVTINCQVTKIVINPGSQLSVL